jgi:threonine dehydrogenase-like Zn-dependent dehydrogenase
VALPGIEKLEGPTPMGHEYVGIVEEIGSDVRNVKVGDFVVGSFVISDNRCEICRSGFQSKCVHAEFVAQTVGTRRKRRASPSRTGRWSRRRDSRTLS